GIDVAHEIRADDVECAALRGDDPAIAELAENERAYAQRIAHRDQAFRRERGERVSALHLMQRVDHPLFDRVLETGGDEMDDDFGVAGRLEEAAAADERLAQLVGIGEIAVMADRESTKLKI